MKLTERVLLCWFLLFGLPLFPQTAGQPTSEPDSIASAHCRYAPADGDCIQRESATAAGDVSLAQIPRGGDVRPPVRSPRMTGYPGSYGSMYTGEGNGRHAVIGALIGFGLGAALGAKANTDQHPGAGVKAAFLVGGIGALIGAAVGRSVPAFQSWNRPRERSWPYEDEDASVRHSRKKDVRLASASPPKKSSLIPDLPLARKEPGPTPPASDE